jgi:hypothetical protein
MSGSLLMLLLVLLIVALVGGATSLSSCVSGERKISEILSGIDLLAHWTYTPDEWEKAVAEEFTWARKDTIGDVYISPNAIYVKSGSGDRLFALTEMANGSSPFSLWEKGRG